MCLTHKFLVICYLLPVVAPSEILLVAKFFTTGSSIYLPCITSTFTQARNLIALLKLSQWKLQLWKRSKGEVRQQKSSAGWHQSTLHSLKNKQTNNNKTKPWPCIFFSFGAYPCLSILSCQSMKCRWSVSWWHLHVMNTCSEVVQICETGVIFMVLIIITQFYWLVHLWGN